MRMQRIGAIEIRKVTEIDRLRVDPHKFFNNMTTAIMAQQRERLGPALIAADSDDLLLSHHSFVVRTRHHVIIVDTCNGNHKERPSMPDWHRLDQPYLANLAAAGVAPADVDYVLCTHLHADHVGWNTRLVNGEWVPTFPNARYVIAETEFAHFNALHAAHPEAPVNRGSFADSVLPVVERGQADIVHSTHRIEFDLGEGVWLEPAPGHTPGNVNVHVRSQGRHALLCGDVIHHPIQFAEPSLELPADFDKAVAMRTRRALMHDYADTPTIVLTGHFPDPTAGRIRSAGERFHFDFDEEAG